MPPIILWFRNDLRLRDNPALIAACKTKQPIVASYVLDDSVRPFGGASRWWLHHSVASLGKSISQLNGKLILRRGNSVEEITKLAKETGASQVFCCRNYGPDDIEARLHKTLDALGVQLKRFKGTLLFEPEDIRTKSQTPFKVFTPFWNNCLGQPPVSFPTRRPSAPSFLHARITTDKLSDWNLLPDKQHNWAAHFQEVWTPGESGAHGRLRHFINKELKGYITSRDIPSYDETSRLSPHLRFGEISPKYVWHQVHSAIAHSPPLRRPGLAYLRQLGWREFSYHLLYHWPTLADKAFKPEFDKFPWRANPKKLKAWQQGKTGYPIVDAGMRQLWHTGWMHNRVRMIAASFLIKDLHIDWREGEAWFWDTLVDADAANNASGWQWVAGSGADAAPYFRIFNPTTQSKKFDPKGAYIGRWVPELKKLASPHIHHPHLSPKQALIDAGVTLDTNYPRPIVDHGQARRYALDAYQRIKNKKQP